MLDSAFLAPHALARWAAETPDAIAVEHVDGTRRTFAAHLDESRRWAAAFRRVGVVAGDHVATMIPNSFVTIDAWLGLGWLRASEVPLNTAYTGRMLHYALATADVTVFVVAAEFLDRLRPIAAELPRLRTVVVLDAKPGDHAGPLSVVSSDEFLGAPGGRIEPAVDLEGPLYRDIGAVIYTSGTTGPSKAVLVPWAGIHQMWSWVPADAVQPGEGLYCPFSPFHIGGKSVLNGALVRGARLVMRDRFSATHFWSDVRATGCVLATTVGPMTALLHAQPARADDADNPLRSILLGPMIPEMEDFERRFGVRTATCYGMTEIGAPFATTWDHGPPHTCGRTRTDYPWTEVRLVDENDEPVAPGAVGELIVRTAEPWALNAGYYNMPDKTAEAWRNGWFHTGDAFRCDEDGRYAFVDRMKDAIRRRGENISSFEVENAVLEHPDVADCAAIGVPAEFGEDEVMVVVVPKDPATFDPRALVAWLQPRMPRFMVPRYVDVVEDLPRNETSLRVRKDDLRARGITATTFDRESSR
ncbi:MAG TPA: AMP-binding protein [Acidimicrobiales bacterium]|nr:AMP-binding protein [Acidimicrobiales bacterium]